MRLARIAGVAVLLLAAARGALAQKKITCPGGEVRYEIDVRELALQYEGWSLSGTLSSLSVLGGRLAVDPKTLQQAAAATQQWNELLKGLAAGYNRCAITREQYARGLERIYPRLKEDGADLEKIRQLLVQGKQADEKRLKALLDSYFANLREFAGLGGQDLLMERIAAVVEREVGKGTDRLAEGQEQILLQLADLKKKFEESPLATPPAVESEIGRKLQDRARAAQEEYEEGYGLMQRFRFAEAVPHLERALAAVKLHDFYIALGDALVQVPDLARAERVLREGLALAVEEHDEAHEAALAHRLGEALRTKGDPAGALASAERALELGEKVLGRDDPTVARSERLVATLLREKGDLDGALRHSRRALEIDDKAFGPDRPETAEDAMVLAAVLLGKGDLDGALDLARRAARAYEAAFGPDHPEVAEAANTLGEVLWTRGDLAGAIAENRRSLAIHQKHFGPDHPRIASDSINLGWFLHEQGDEEGGLRLTRRALEIYETTFGPNHPQVALCASNLAWMLKAKKDYDGALGYARRALAIDEAALGPDHPDVASDLNTLGRVLQEKGDLDGARQALERALASNEKTFGPDHAEVAVAAGALASVLRQKGDLEGSLRNARRALAIDEKTFGPGHPNVADDLRHLARTLEALGDLSAALAAAERSFRIYEKSYGPENPQTRYAAEALEALKKKQSPPG